MKKSLILTMSVLSLFSCSKDSSEKSITAFSIGTVAGVIHEEQKTIAIALPVGTDVSALVPVIATSGNTKVSPASGKPQDFTLPVIYTVTAKDGSSARYTVAVTVTPNGEAQITALSLGDVQGTVDHAEKLVTVIVPYGTDITRLSPLITVSDEAGVSPESGVVQDFSVPVAYTVTAGNQRAVTYTVTVTIAPFHIVIAGVDASTVTRGKTLTLTGIFAASDNAVGFSNIGVTYYLYPTPEQQNTASITIAIPETFKLGAYTLSVKANGNEVSCETLVEIVAGEQRITFFRFTSLNPVVTATINEEEKTIAATVPYGTNVTWLAPLITVSDEANISPASGTAQDFTVPVVYTVTAVDHYTVMYVVTVAITPFHVSIANVSKTSVPIGEQIIVGGIFADDGNIITLRRPGVEIVLTPYRQSASALSVVIAPSVEAGSYTLSVTSNGAEVSYPAQITVTAASGSPRIISLDKSAYIIGTDRLEITGINFPNEGVAQVNFIPVKGGTTVVRNINLIGNTAILSVIPGALSPDDYEVSIYFEDSRQWSNNFPIKFVAN